MMHGQQKRTIFSRLLEPVKQISVSAGMLCLLLAQSVHPAEAPSSHGPDIAAIKAAREASNRAIAAHDAAAVASFWDEDYVISISTGSIERGAAVAQASFAQHFEDFPDVIYIRSPEEISISEAYPLAWERGSWKGSRTTANGVLQNGGQYAAGWRKVDGAWKIRSELFVGLKCEGSDC